MTEFLVENSGNIALAGFFTAFVLIMVAVLRPSKKAELEGHKEIPLRETE